MAAPEPVRVERKVVTVLFCDLVGFTARSDQADPEDVRAILQPFHAIARAEIERHGGTLDKFIGDAAMGVFGSPATHEDDPERAVRAALRILGRIDELNERRAGDPLKVRVGLNTGEAVVTMASGVQEGENVAGDVVNTASRLQSSGPVGAVVVGEETFRATRGAVEYQELEPVTAKGKAEPLPVWRALSIRPHPTISDRPAETPFVGREDERTRLERALLRAFTRPALQLVTVVGEPGVGKSRLVSELRGSLPTLVPEATVGWRRGRCLPYGEGITFWALGEIVKDEAGILESDPQQERDAKVTALLELLVPDPADRAWFRTRLSPLVGGEAGSPVERDEAFAAWRRFLEAVAGANPLVAVFEDIHWADHAMLQFLEYLAESSPAAPVLIVATARPELRDRYPGWFRIHGTADMVSLQPLSEAETASLLSALPQTTSLPSEASAALLERSGGNPLYAQELARALREGGFVDGDGRLVRDVGEVDLPPTIQALIAARIDALPRDRKPLVQDAAVIGKTFWSGAVAHLAGVDEEPVRDHLLALEDRELIRASSPSSIQGQVEYTFWHALIRDVAYGQIPRADRALKHRKGAAWIEAISGHQLADVAEILAYHATTALELAEAAGQTEDFDALRGLAARYLRLSAARAMALDLGKAEVELLRAMDLIPPGHPDGPRIEASLAEVAFHGGRLEEAARRYEDAIRGLHAQGAASEAAEAMVRRSVVLEYRGDAAAGRRLLSDAIALLSQSPPGPELARALATSAGSLMVAGRYQEAISEADRAIELSAATGEEVAAGRAHGFRGYARVIQGDLEGLAEQRQALATLSGRGIGRGTAIVYNNLGSCLSHVEGSKAALDLLQEGVAFAQSRGLREMVMALQNASLTVLYEVGEWDEVLRLSEQVIEEARRQGSGYDEIYAEADRAVILAFRTGAKARAFCEAVLERARRLEDPPVLMGALIAAATARYRAEDTPGTVQLLEEALAASSEDVVVRAGELPHLVRLAIAVGDASLGERFLEGSGEFRLERYRLALSSARAALDEDRGSSAAAVDAYADVERRWARWGHVLERAYAAFGAGRCLVRLERQDEAAPRLRSAREAFVRLGAEPLAQDVSALQPEVAGGNIAASDVHRHHRLER